MTPSAIWLFLIGLLAVRHDREIAPPLAEQLIILESIEGAALLRGAEARVGYDFLMRHFEAQTRSTFCGPATMAMLLNALDETAPQGMKRLKPFNQYNVFPPGWRGWRRRRGVKRAGMPLAVFARALATHGVKLQTHYAYEIGPADFRQIARAVLGKSGQFVAVNYHRSVLGQVGEGHFSPVAAYNAEADRFLVLDVARSKYPPVWVETVRLYDAMNQPGGGRPSRGFVTIKM